MKITEINYLSTMDSQKQTSSVKNQNTLASRVASKPRNSQRKK
jgi:hypothetical protein